MILLKAFWRDTRKKIFCIAELWGLFFDVVGRQKASDPLKGSAVAHGGNPHHESGISRGNLGISSRKDRTASPRRRQTQE